MKIGQYLAKIWTRVYCAVFLGPPCMQALHRKLDVLVQILPYNCSETDYSFRKDSLPAGLRPLPTEMRVSPSDHFSPPSPLFFRSAAPGRWSGTVVHLKIIGPQKGH